MPTRSFFYIMVLNVLFTKGLAKIYPVVELQKWVKVLIKVQILAWCACGRPRSLNGFSAGAV